MNILIKRYKTTSLQDKERLIRAFESNQDWIYLSSQMGINFNTANGIVSRYKKNNEIQGKRGGHKKFIITPEIGDCLVDYVEKNNLATLKDMELFNMEQYKRREHLLGAIETTISETRELNLEPYYRHSSTFYVRCIERADIMGDKVHIK